jgi:hypothetical protein
MPRDQFLLRAQALFVDLLIAAVAMLTMGFVVGANFGSFAAGAAAITGGLYSTIESSQPPRREDVRELEFAGVWLSGRTITLLALGVEKHALAAEDCHLTGSNCLAGRRGRWPGTGGRILRGPAA